MKARLDPSQRLLRIGLVLIGVLALALAVAFIAIGIWHPVPTGFNGALESDGRWTKTGALFLAIGVPAFFVRWMLWMSDGERW